MTTATQSQSVGKLLDYEQFIDHQLQRTRRRIKLTDIATACLTLLVGFLGILFLEIVLDHIVGMPYWLRWTIMVGGLLAAATYTALRLVLPVISRINALYAAKTIEMSEPAFKNSLINYLELRRNRDNLPRAVLATLESRAVTDLTQVDVDSTVNQRRMMMMIYALSAVIVVYAFYLLVAPRSILDSARRAFLADVSRPTYTQLVNVKPGENTELAEIVAGTHVNFEVESQGVRPDKVRLHHSVDGGKFFAVKELTPGKKLYDPWQFTMTNVQQDVDYYFTGGDAETRRYHLEVKPAPTIVSLVHDLEFPAYTKTEARKDIDGGEVEAIVGTKVKVRAKTNMPARSATINFAAQDVPPAQMDVVKGDPTQLTGTFTVEKSGTYRISFRTLNNQVNPSPVNYDIIAIPDLPPTAKFVRPEQPVVQVPSNVKVDLMMTASDDHGVKDAILYVVQGKELPTSKNLLEGRAPQTEFRATETLDLTQLKPRPGDKITYWLLVRDNKDYKGSNKFETARQIIEISEPLPAQEKKKLEEKQAQERQQLDRDNQASPDAAQRTDQADNQPQGDGNDQKDIGKAEQQQEPQRNPAGQQAQNAAGGQDGGANDNANQQPGQPQVDPADQDKVQKLAQALNNVNNKSRKGQTNAQGGGAAAGQPQAGNPGDAQSAPGANGANNNAGNQPPQARPNQQQPAGQPGAAGNNQGAQGGNPGDPNNKVQPGIRENAQPGAPQSQNNPAPGAQGGRQQPVDDAQVAPGQQGQQGQPQPGGANQPQPGGANQPQPGGANQPQPGGANQPQQGGTNKPQQGGMNQPGGANQPQPGGANQPQPGGANQPQQGGTNKPQQGGMNQPGGANQPQPGGANQPQPGGANNPSRAAANQPQPGGPISRSKAEPTSPSRVG